MGAYIDREQALSHPFANGQYDYEHANEHFIFGFESYREWLEDLPTIDIVKCEECKYEYSCGHQIKRNGLILKLTRCEYGERRADEID